MSRAVATALALFFLLTTALPVAANDPEPPRTPEAGEIIPGQVIVKWRDAERGADVARARGLARVAEVGAPDSGVIELLATGGRPVDAVVAELSADPAVEYAEPNYRVALAAVSVNDPLTGGQYSLDRMRVRDAWSLSKGGTGIVAVLDTGVQADHPDLMGRVLRGYDFVNTDSDAADDNGHGTWVAGIVAANTNDGYGVAGISWTDRILPVKIMNSSGTGTTSQLTSGITWSANNGATVINMSVGGFPYSQAVQDAVNYAWNKGAVLVGAAGNNNRSEIFYPASYDNVVSVSATQVNDEFSHWSSHGPKVDVSAPGSSVRTTNCTAGSCPNRGWGSHTYISGTSFATPNVAGVVALIRARYPGYTPSQVVNRLLATVDDLGYLGREDRYGLGRVNAYRALGGSIVQPASIAGDTLESNDALSSARLIPLGSATRPNIYPAGDVDVFAVDVPRAGRLDVSVTGVVDTRDYPWNRSSLPIDPIVELYNAAGTLLVRVDKEYEAGTELGQTSVGGPARVFVRVSNYYANGNTSAYSVTPTFVDTVPPAVVARSPAPNAVSVSYDGAIVTADFTEPVGGVSTSTMVLKTSSGSVVPATVGYSSSARRATLRPSVALAGEATYTVTLTAGIKDQVGHALATTSWSFTTGKAVPRIAGADRYATAAALSASAYGPGVPVVYVATGASFPDALAAGPAARAHGGPLLLTAQSFLPAATTAELKRLKPGRIVVVGGSASVSDKVAADLRAYTSGAVERRAGADRFATAAEISRTTFATGVSVAYVATGMGFPDALSAGAVAARAKAPILLTRHGELPDPTVRELERLAPASIVVMGGPSVVSDAVVQQLKRYASSVTRVSGADRYATAVRLSQSAFPGGAKTVYVATGSSFPDGLATGPVAGKQGAPLLLVGTTTLPSSVAAELKRLNPTNVVIVGGTSVVSENVRKQIRALWP